MTVFFPNGDKSTDTQNKKQHAKNWAPPHVAQDEKAYYFF